MSQADQTIQNNTFPTVRADINSNLAALFSGNSGNTAPSVKVAFQDWIDTSGANPIWKKRNSANNAWITLGTLSASTVAFEGTLPSQTGNAGKFLTTNATIASWAAVTVGATVQAFISSTTYTPTAGKSSFLVFCTGGGGGSGSVTISGLVTSASTGGGGGGGTAIRIYTTTEMGSTATITIGAGGSPSAAGGASIFTPSGSGLVITGSGGGGSASVSSGSSNGGSSGATINSLIDCQGLQGDYPAASDVGGTKGSTFWAGGSGTGGNGVARTSSGTTTGSAGTAGVIFILEW